MTSSPQNDQEEFVGPGDFFTTPITIYCVFSAGAIILLWIYVYYVPEKVGKGGVSLQTLALPLLSAWLLSLSKLFNAGLGRVPEDDYLELQWVWLSAGLFGLAAAVISVNVAALERISTHIFMPIAFGFTAVIMGLQGFLFGEFEGISQEALIMWLVGLGVAMSGTALVAIGSPKEDHEVEEQEQFLEENEELFEAMELKLSVSMLSLGTVGSGRERREDIGRELF